MSKFNERKICGKLYRKCKEGKKDRKEVSRRYEENIDNEDFPICDFFGSFVIQGKKTR